MPSSAPAVAAATPCWPAPVSAMMRRAPMRLAKSACPIALLILCAPVWLVSSRLSAIVAPPIARVRFSQVVSGVGRPTYSRSSRWYSVQNDSSAIASANACSRILNGSTNTSGTKRPPYRPKYPRASGPCDTICLHDRLRERGDELRVLASVALDAAAHIDPVWPQGADGVCHVIGRQASGQNERRSAARADTSGERIAEPDSCAAVQSGAARIGD